MIMFNDICMITVAWDNVKESKFPKSWDMRRLYILAAVLCVTVAALQLLFLMVGYAALLPSAQQPAPMNLLWALGYHEVLQFSEMETMMYISLSWAGFLTLLACRNEGFFYESLPGKELAGAFVASIGATTLLGSLLKADSIAFWATPAPVILVTLVWNILAFFILDAVKAFASALLDTIEGKISPLAAKSTKMSLWAQNRATLASRDTGRDTGRNTGEPSYRRSGAGFASASGAGVGLPGGEIEKLQSAVAQLAGLVGTVQPEAKAAVADILASLRE